MKSSAPTATELQHRLQSCLNPSALEVIDESAAHRGHAGDNGLGYGSHFRVRVTSPLFVGRSAVARHRLVYDALREFMDRGLHALAIETQVPVADPGGPTP